MKREITRTQALLTAIGFMIGSGIFFRADNIVSATQGNVIVPIISWIFMGTTIVFAGVAVSVLASRTETTGGFIGYFEDHFGKKAAFIVGWYQVVVYVPIMVAVLSITLLDYLTQLLGTTLVAGTGSLTYYLICAIIIIVVIAWNGISTKIASVISSSATVIKLIPLFLIAILGIIKGDPTMLSATQAAIPVGGEELTTIALFFAPMLSMAFAFDGWISVGSLAVDMKDPKKDLPFVFTWSVIVTTIVYTAYFIGVNCVITDPNVIINEGNAHVGLVAEELFGPNGYTFVLICVVISVLGTLNSIVMAGARYVQKLGVDGLLPASKFFASETPQGTYVNASIWVGAFSLVFLALYYVQEAAKVAGETGLITQVVIDDIPMALNSVIYIVLFTAVFKVYKAEKANKGVSTLEGVVAPIIGSIGQAFIVFAFFVTASAFWIPTVYMIISAIIIALGLVVCSKGLKNIND